MNSLLNTRRIGWKVKSESEARHTMPFWVYILRCSDGSYYTGHTDDLQRRVGMHQTGEIPGYTKTRRPVDVIYSQQCVTREEALSAELQIKGRSRSKKEAIARGDWQELRSLARNSKRRR
jgi:predicted GIY-YIG superfamily endonuclease